MRSLRLLLCCGIVLSLAGEARAQDTPRPKRKGPSFSVLIESTPSGAEIYLDDEKYGVVGTTPWKGKLRKGKWRVIIKKEGYATATQVFGVRPIRRRMQKASLNLVQEESGDSGDSGDSDDDDSGDSGDSDSGDSGDADKLREIEERLRRLEGSTSNDGDSDDSGEDTDTAEPDTTSEPTPEPTPKPPKVAPGPGPILLAASFGPDGYRMESSDGAFELKIGLEARVQAAVFDGKVSDDYFGEPAKRLALQPRLLQIYLNGRIHKKFEIGMGVGLSAEPDRPLDNAQITYADFRYYLNKDWRIRGGYIVVPFGLETGSYFFETHTIERSMAMEAIAPFRDGGFVLEGSIGDVHLAVAAISGTPPNIVFVEPNTFSTFRTGDDPDGVARVRYTSYANASDRASGAQPRFSVGLSGQLGKQPSTQDGLNSLFVTRMRRDNLFDATSRGLRYRAAGDYSFNIGGFDLRGEVVYERQRRINVFNEDGQEVAEGGTVNGSPVKRLGGYVEVAQVITGTPRQEGFEAVLKGEYFAAESLRGVGVLNPVELFMGTGGFNYYFRRGVRLQVNGIVTDIERKATPEDPAPVLQSHLENRTAWIILTQFQVFIL